MVLLLDKPSLQKPNLHPCRYPAIDIFSCSGLRREGSSATSYD